ncbi:MAG: hypothetical protein ACYCX4_12865 [Bacillota bacterium]
MRDLFKLALVIVLAVALVTGGLNIVDAKINGGNADQNQALFKFWREGQEFHVVVMGKAYQLPMDASELSRVTNQALPYWKDEADRILDKANRNWQKIYRQFNEQMLTWSGN